MTDWIQSLLHLDMPPGWNILGKVYFGNLMHEALYYGVSALVFWAVLHRLLKHRWRHRLIGDWPSSADIRREMAYSLSSLLVFASLGLVMVAGLFNGSIVIYRQPDAHGWAWLALSLPALVMGQDLYFYATHRLLHTRWLFRHVHGVHHRSRQPSPWAAYAFHPVEALINGAFTPLALLVVPVHGGVLMAFALHQIIRNTLGHSALEAMPAGFTRHWLGRWFTTTTHHHLHHETGRGNYGLWFTWWDRCFGTERIDYLGRFDTATRGLLHRAPAPRRQENAHATRQSPYAPADH
jgi:Delta7-sterol 5-desaturase